MSRPCDDDATLPPTPAVDDDATLTGVRPGPGGSTAALDGLRQLAAATAPAANPAASTPPAPPGYAIEKELGRGGMGVVYLARQVGLNRRVALKMVLSGGHASSQELVRFLAEAEAIAQLRHPNVVQIFEVGAHDDRPYFTLEFCGGGGLDGKLGGNPLTPADAARYAEDVARGVAAAHAAGIVHRDLKPANVLLADDGTPKVTDFGLAKRVGSGSDLTATGAVMGTPSYMAPEQAAGKGKEVGPAADVYALGAILYELLTGRPPFKAATPLDTLLLAVTADPVPPRQLNPLAPADLETITLKCLAKDPAKRYPTADELADDLARYRGGEPITARPAGPGERAWKWVRRNKMMAAAATSVAVALLLGAGVATWQAVRAGGEAERAGRAEKAATDRAEAEAAAKRDAEAARTQADLDRRRAVAAEEDAIDQVYATSIDLAHREWEQNNLYRAEQLLNETPARLRGWEWHYLRSLTRLEEQTLRGHLGELVDVTVSPDGSRVMSVDLLGGLKVWDRATGRELLSAADATGPLLFSGDGKFALVATGSVVKLVSAADGTEVHRLALQRVNAAVFLDGGKRLLTVNQFGGAVTEWDTATGKKVADRAAVIPAEGLSQLSRFGTRLSPDGSKAAFGTNGGLTRVIDLTTGKTLHELQGPPMHVCGIAFHPKGKLLAVGAPNGTVQLWDLEAKKEVRRLRAHASSVDALAFSPNGRQLASGGQDMAARVWDVDTWTEVRTLRGHTSNVRCVAFTPDGNRLVTGSPDRSVRVWELADTRHGGTLRALIGLSVSAKGGGDVGTLISPAAGGHHTYYGHAGPTRFVAISPDGAKAATTNNGDGAVTVWDLESHKQLQLLQFPKGCRGSVAFDPAGKRLALTFRGPSAGVRVWELGKAELVFSAEVSAPDGDKTVAAFTPDGESLLGCWPTDRASEVRAWDLGTKKEAEPLPVDGLAVNALAFTPDRRSLVVGANNRLMVYDWPARKLARSAEVPYSETTAIGRHGQAACAGHDGVIRLYDLATLEPVRQLEGHVGRLWAVAFHPDGSRLVSAGNEMTVKVWNTRTGRELLTFRDHVREVQAVAWGGDGRRIASCGWDGMMKVWSVPAEDRDSTGRWPVLFAADFNKPDALEGWKAGENWSIEGGAAKGTLVTTPLPGGGTFPMAQLLPPVPPLPTTVELRYTVWAPKPAVAEGTLVHPTNGLSIHTILGSDRKSGGASARMPGAFVLTMRGGITSEVVGVPRTKFKFEPDRKYQFRVRREKTRLTVTVDGEHVLSEDVPAGEAPTLMLAGSWGELGEPVYFDDVEVRAPEAAVHERRLLDRLDGWFAQYLMREAVAEQVDAAADLSDADRRFLKARAATLVEDPSKISTAAIRTVERADATAAEYAVALRQAEALVRLQPGNSAWAGVRGLAEFRAGKLEAAAETLREVIDRRADEVGSAGPVPHAALAIIRHRQGKAGDASELARRAKDMLYGEHWAAVSLAVSMVAEAEKEVGLPAVPEQDAVCRAVFGPDQRGWNHADLPAFLASYATDARVTHGRSNRPDGHDVVFDRTALAGTRGAYFAVTSQERYVTTYQDVSVIRTGDSAELKFTKTDAAGVFFVTWSAAAKLRRAGGGWVIAELRQWPVRIRRGDWRREFTPATYRTLDDEVEVARKGGDRGKLVVAMIAARQFGAALAAARDLTRRPDATADDWIQLAESAFESGQPDDMYAAVREALSRDPSKSAPWFLSRQQRSHRVGAGQLFALARHPDHTGVVFGGADRKVHWFDPSAGKAFRSTAAEHQGVISDAQYSPDGKAVASVALDGRLYLWAADTGQWRWWTAAHAGHALRLAFRPDGTQLVTCGDDRTVLVWDAASGKPVREMTGHTGPVFGVAWSPDGKRIASASTDGTVRVWDADAGTELYAPLRPPLKERWEAYRVTFSPDGKRIAASGSGGTIRLWDADTRKELHVLSGLHTQVVEPIVFSPDGKSLVSGGYDARIVWWDLTTGKPREVLRGHTDGVFALGWGATAEELHSASSDGTVRTWTLKPW